MEGYANEDDEDSTEREHSDLLSSSIIRQRSSEDVDDAIDKDNSGCNHFSIRAYVAEIRRRDWKICWPFHSFGDSKQPNDQAAIAEKFCEGREAIFKTSKPRDSFEFMPMVDLLRRQKFATLISEVNHEVFMSRKFANKVVSSIDERMTELSVCKTKNAQCLNGEIVIKERETTSSGFGYIRLSGTGNTDSGTPSIGELESDKKESSFTSNSLTETCQKEGHVDHGSKIENMSEHGRGVIDDAQNPESESVEDQDLYPGAISSANKFASESNQHCMSEDNDDIHDQNHSSLNDSSSKYMKYKRPVKVRLLADILKTDISRAYSGPSGSSEIGHSDKINNTGEDADESDDFTIDTLFRNQNAVQTSIGDETTKKKRKMLQAEDMGPCQTRKLERGSEYIGFHHSSGENNCNPDFEPLSCQEKINIINDLFFKTKKRCRKSRQPSTKTNWQQKIFPELQLTSRDVENKKTRIGTLHLNLGDEGPIVAGFKPSQKFLLGAQNCYQKCSSSMKRISDNDSLLLPLKGVPPDEYVTVSNDAGIQSYIPEPDSGRDAPSHMRNVKGPRMQKDSSLASNRGNSVNVQAHLTFANNLSREKVDKVCDSEALDDISMEIVKLLADNRREKRLLEAQGRPRSAHDITDAHTVHQFHEAKGYLSFAHSQEKHSYGNQFPESVSIIDFATSSYRMQSRKLDLNVPNNIGTEAPCAATFPEKQSRNFDVEISNKIDSETACPCVQKKIGKCPESAGPPNVPSVINTGGMSSRKSFEISNGIVCAKEFSLPQNIHSVIGVHGVNDAYASPFAAEFDAKLTLGQPTDHSPLVKRDSKSCKVVKSKNSFLPMKATNDGLLCRNQNLWRHHQLHSINSVDKGLSCAPNGLLCPLDSHLVKNRTLQLKVNKNGGEAQAERGSRMTGICVINRNPAEFSIPGYRNKYMRRGGGSNPGVKKLNPGVEVA